MVWSVLISVHTDGGLLSLSYRATAQLCSSARLAALRLQTFHAVLLGFSPRPEVLPVRNVRPDERMPVRPPRWVWGTLVPISVSVLESPKQAVVFDVYLVWFSTVIGSLEKAAFPSQAGQGQPELDGAGRWPRGGVWALAWKHGCGHLDRLWQ